MDARIEAWRANGLRIAFTHGAFDLVHAGHVEFLEKAALQGDRLVVGVHRDEHIRAYKGPDRPILELRHRLRVVGAFRCVDLALELDDPDAALALIRLRPDVYVKDSGARVEDSPEANVMATLGKEVVIVPYTPGISTSMIVCSLKRGGHGKPGGVS